MPSAFNKKWLYISAIGFLIAALAAVFFEQESLLLLPLGGAILYVLVVKPVYIIYLLAFATPLSVQWSTESDSLAMAVPTEPLIILMFIGLLLKLLMSKKISFQVFHSVLALLITTDLLWLTVTTATSTMPLISLKYLLSKIWYLVVFYFFLSKVFAREKAIKTFMWSFIVGASV